MNELNSAAFDANELLLLLGTIGVVGIIGGVISEKIKIPDVVLYLLLGILSGPIFFNIVDVTTFPIANELILTFGSAFILYEGGREVKLKVLGEVKRTVGLLATLGVVISTIIIGIAAWFIFKLPIMTALLLGAVIASTDPASLIPIFSQITLNKRLKQTIISESAFNDAVGAILVTTLISIIKSNDVALSKSFFELLIMIAVGILGGALIGAVVEILCSDKSYGFLNEFAPIMGVLAVIFAYEFTDQLGGSGYMAVFVAGLISGNKKKWGLWTPESCFVSGVHFRENIATLSRMAIFIVLGTKVDLQNLVRYAPRAILIVLILMFIARPTVVWVCTKLDRKVDWKKNEIFFMMWVRETGVIPAALSGMIVSMELPGYTMISSTVFMTILITLLLQASTTAYMARKLEVLEN